MPRFILPIVGLSFAVAITAALTGSVAALPIVPQSPPVLVFGGAGEASVAWIDRARAVVDLLI